MMKRSTSSGGIGALAGPWGRWVLVGVLSCLACHPKARQQAAMEASAPPSTVEEKPMTTEDKKFFAIELDTNSPNECSPKVPSGAGQVIAIAAPTRVPFERGKLGPRGAFAIVPICGTTMMSVPSPPTNEPIVFHVQDPKTKKTYEGPLRMLDESPDIPPDDDVPPSPESLKGVFVTSYFNQNLLDHVALPIGAGKYEVYVSWRGVISNHVPFEIFEQKATGK